MRGPKPSLLVVSEVVVGLWDEVDEREINKHLDQVKAEDDEEQYSP